MLLLLQQLIKYKVKNTISFSSELKTDCMLSYIHLNKVYFRLFCVQTTALRKIKNHIYQSTKMA